MTKNVLIFLMMCVPSFAVADEPFTAAKMEKLGKLAGQLSLHANVLKNLDTLCYPNKPETNYTASLDSDIKAMPENTQEIMVLQTSTVNNLAAIVANGIIKKANGCETNDFKNAYLQVEDMYQNALLNWFQKNI